jgi:dTDP-4-dehydrorhamnose reductase
MRILVTGCKGMLGQDLIPRLERTGFDLQCVDIGEMDITKAKLVLDCVRSAAPDMVLNCSAYTAVDKAESEPEQAFAVNRDGSANLASACSKTGIPMIHISTDYVFDGESSSPYSEDDAPNPIGVYARSKWEGEEEVRRRLERYIIVRTSWLFGSHGNNFVKTILRLAAERDELRIINDQKGCPTWTGHLAQVLARTAATISERGQAAPWGTYHYCGGGPTTWFDFAVDIVHKARRHKELRVSRVIPISTSEYPTPAKRPMYSVLDCDKIRRKFGVRQMLWKEGLDVVMKELMGSKPI